MTKDIIGYVIMGSESMDFVENPNVDSEEIFSLYMTGNIDKAYVFQSPKKAREWIKEANETCKVPENLEIVNYQKTIIISKYIPLKDEEKDRTHQPQYPFTLCRENKKENIFPDKFDLRTIYGDKI